jgi:hypothetical protein
MEQSMERRDFIRNALVTGGALSVPGGLMAHTLSISEELTTASDELLKGVSDIHVHALPDSQCGPSANYPLRAKHIRQDTVR